MKRFIAFYLLTAVVLLSVQVCPAQTSSNDWNSIGNYLDREIAVKTKRGGTKFGVLKTASADEIKVQVVEKKNQGAAETIFRRDEIEKIWSAQLRYGGRNIAKGALLGAGAGAAAGLVYVMTAAKGDQQTGPDGQAGVAVPVLALGGAVLGGLFGAFSKKGHKKINLIYSN